MPRPSSSDTVSTSGLLLRLGIPLIILAAIVGGAIYVVAKISSGIVRPAGVASDETRYIDAEWVPDAEMGSLLPGRFEFDSGDRDVVVISRVIERTPVEAGEIERLWLQLPKDFEVGKPVDLAMMQAASDLGFDRGVYREGVFAAYPQVTGSVTLRQRTDDFLLVELKGELKPPAGPTWPLDDVHVAHRAPGGRHAQRSNGSKQAAPVFALAAPAPVANIVGQWFGELVDDQDRSLFDAYYQFNADGRFAHSTGRAGGSGAGYSPGMKYGVWRLQGDRLTLRVDIFVFDEPENNDHMDLLNGQPLLLLKVVPTPDGFVFTGDLRAPGSPNLKLKRLKPVTVPDLFKHRPNPDRKPGFYELPMPAPDEVVPRTR